MIIPNQDRLIIKRIDIEQKSEGGLILTASGVSDATDVAYGEVIHVGPGKAGVPIQAQIGDVITYNPRQPMEWIYKGEQLFILRDSDVFTYLRDENIEKKTWTDVASDFKGSKGPQMLG